VGYCDDSATVDYRDSISIVGYWNRDGDSISFVDYLRPQSAGHEARHSAESPPLPPPAP